jgi:hypothetical protein
LQKITHVFLSTLLTWGGCTFPKEDVDVDEKAEEDNAPDPEAQEPTSEEDYGENSIVWRAEHCN